jgi:predicted ATPase/DNA-binding CsgD family transcriptional regulator
VADLPVHLTGFVGRRPELAAVEALLRTERLVTVTGPGGAGKTRLAAEVAGHWPDDVRWVALESVIDETEVAEQLAAALGVLVEPVRGPLRSATLQLEDRTMLVCLDNCEQVLDAVAEAAVALLRSCPGVTVLTTSREPLGVAGEAVWRVPPLADDDALALFVERGRLVQPAFTLDAASEAAIRTMCSRLDGMPLALELAAAWLPALTPQQIEAALDDRFALLVRGARGAVPRQQTLAASIDWSHALLDEADRIALRRLAVFAGGFELEAARSVAGADPVAIGRLVDKSLVVAEVRDGEARYRLPETIREYAAERLEEAGETGATRDRHLDHFLAALEGMEALRERDMDAWRVRVEREHGNLRAALDRGLAARDPERGRRLAAELPWLWHLHRHGHEGIEYLQRAVRRAPADRSALQARLLTGIALVADTARPLDLEFDAAQRALEIATEQGDDRLRGLCLALSGVGQFYTDFAAAWDLAAAAIDTGDAFVADAARALQGIILHLRDRHEDAEPLLQSAVDGLSRRHRGIAATTLGFQATGAACTGQIDRARDLAERAVQVAAPLGDYLRVGSTRSVLAYVCALAGDLDAGSEAMRPVLRLVEGVEDDVFVPGMAHAMGTLLLRRGEPDGAAAWFEREARSTDRGTETWLAGQALPGLGAALRMLGRSEEAHDVLGRAVVVAGRLDMPRQLAAALEQQAHLAATDDAARATELHHRALAIRVEHGLRAFYADSLDALAALDPRFAGSARMTLDEAVAYVRRGRGPRGRPRTGWASLTPTELDVVRLVAEGLSNPGIGNRLFISRGTVKTHLSHVYAKLGVANRTELAALAGGRREPRS